jgi:hypothetical protein
MEDTSTQVMNPWVSIWTKPRATIQQIIDTNPKHLVLLLATIGGFSTALDRASTRSLGDKLDWTMILLIVAIVGPIAGIITLYIGSALLRWTGKWIGGNASSQSIRAAIAWSTVPEILALVLWIPALALFGPEMFTSEIPSIQENPALNIAFLSIAAVGITVGIWQFVIYLKCLGQVQGFSAWKALGNSFMALMVVILPIVTIYVTLLAVNWSDRPPSEAALRLEGSYRSRPAIPDEENAYVYLMGFSVAKAENPQEWGARRIAWEKALVNRSQVDIGSDYPGEDFDFKQVRSAAVRAFAEACKSIDKQCLAALGNGESSIAEWLATEEWRIDRYRRLLSHPGWLETVPLDLSVPVPSYSDVFDAQKLFFVKAWALSGQGDARRVRTLLDEDMRFWREVLGSSDTILTKMVAVAALTRNFTWSNIILRRLPADIAAEGVPRQWMTPLSDSERSMARCVTGEWLLFDSTIKQLNARGIDVPVTDPVREENSIGHYVVWQVLGSLYQPQDTSNKYAELLEAITETLDVPYEGYVEAVERVRVLTTQAVETNGFPHHIYNIVGNL